MPNKNTYKDYIPWPVLEALLYDERDKAFTEFMRAEGLQEVGRAQGRALALNDLLNLPETLALREGLHEDKE